MIILGGGGAAGGFDITTSAADGITVAAWDGSEREVKVYLDQNHAEALETALRAARLEIQARAVSR